MRELLGLAGVLLGLPGLVTAAHLTLLTAGSWLYREHGAGDRMRFLIVVPARDEEAVIGATVASIMRARRPGDVLVVVADRCTDATADIARGLGAEVLEYRGESGVGKGAAINAAVAAMRDREWDHLTIIDADCLVEPGFFEAVEARLARGFAAVQPRIEHQPGRTVLSRLAEVAFALQGVTLPRGRHALGLSVRLRGPGMTVRRDLALANEFRSGVSEDLFYGLRLIAQGHRFGHVDRAVVRTQPAPSLAAGARQRVRWEQGRIAAAREMALPLLRTGRPAAVEAAVHLVTPPIGVAALSLGVGALWSAFLGWKTAAWVMVGGGAGIALVVLTALIQSRASWRTWAALAAAPFYAVWKGWIQLRALATLDRASEAFDRTERG